MTYDDPRAWKDVTENFPTRTIYDIYLLKKGRAWTAEEAPELDALQIAHLANRRRLASLGKLVINGLYSIPLLLVENSAGSAR